MNKRTNKRTNIDGDRVEPRDVLLLLLLLKQINNNNHIDGNTVKPRDVVVDIELRWLLESLCAVLLFKILFYMKL